MFAPRSWLQCCGQPVRAGCNVSSFQREQTAKPDGSGLGVSCGLFSVSGVAKNACLQVVNVDLGPRSLALRAEPGSALKCAWVPGQGCAAESAPAFGPPGTEQFTSPVPHVSRRIGNDGNAGWVRLEGTFRGRLGQPLLTQGLLELLAQTGKELKHQLWGWSLPQVFVLKAGDALP